MGKFVIKQSNSGYSFSLKASNGATIAVSQTYAELDSCRNGVQSVMNNAPVANFEDQTVAGFEVQKHPKFELYKDKAGEFRFRLKAKNGQVIAIGEGYKTHANCVKGIESVKKNAVDAVIVEE